MFVDAEARLGLGERARFARHRRLAVGDALVVDQAGHVVPDRRLEFGLVGLELEHLRVRLQLVERGGDRLVRHALGRGVGAQRGDAGGEVGAGGRSDGERRGE